MMMSMCQVMLHIEKHHLAKDLCSQLSKWKGTPAPLLQASLLMPPPTSMGTQHAECSTAVIPESPT